MKVYGVQLYLQLTVQNLIQKPPIMQKRSSWTETLTDRHEKTQEYTFSGSSVTQHGSSLWK